MNYILIRKQDDRFGVKSRVFLTRVKENFLFPSTIFSNVASKNTTRNCTEAVLLGVSSEIKDSIAREK